MRKLMSDFLLIFATLVICGFLISLGGLVATVNPPEGRIGKASLLYLDLDGIILDGKDFLENLRKYAAEDHIKGVLIKINSPGGVVGPSQEIYSELKRIREELKKPVVVSCNALAASGAYYAAVAADKIITNPGTLMGSIGVIMEFANLEKLYDWAHINRYSIKTGAYKDAGADYRPMTQDEKALFQDMINEVLEQFKKAVMEGRKLDRDVVDKYADGRIFVGETAVKLGFADQVGTFEDARRLAGEMAGLGKDPELFKPKKKRENIFELLGDASSEESRFEKLAGRILNLDLSGRPLYLMPGALGN